MLSKISFRSVLPFLGFAAFIALSACSDNDAQPLSGPEYQIESNDQGKSSRSTDAKSSPRNRRPAFAQGKSSSSTDAKSSSSSKAKSSSSSKVGSSSSLQTSSSAVSSSSEAGVTACKTANVDNCKYGTLTDERDGQTYKTIKIGSQTWMAENLNYAYLEPTEDLDSSSFCFDNDPAKCDTLGRLYLWSAAMDSAGKLIEPANGCGYGVYCSASGTSEAIRGICPAGWHVPSMDEWNVLANSMGVGGPAMARLKSSERFDENYEPGTDDCGFSSLPAGEMFKTGDVSGAYRFDVYWTSTAMNLQSTYAPSLNSYRGISFGQGAAKMVLRCVKD